MIGAPPSFDGFFQPISMCSLDLDKHSGLFGELGTSNGFLASTDVSVCSGSLWPCWFSAITLNSYSCPSFSLFITHDVPLTNSCTRSHLSEFLSRFSTIYPLYKIK